MKTITANKTVPAKRPRDGGLLTIVAESIGSAIGSIVGKATTAQKSLAKNDETRITNDRGKAPVKKNRTASRKNKPRPQGRTRVGQHVKGSMSRESKL
jgi:hypothetical protein